MGRGVCQDFAHIAIALARVCDIGARYASGHLIGEVRRTRGSSSASLERTARRCSHSIRRTMQKRVFATWSSRSGVIMTTFRRHPASSAVAVVERCTVSSASN